MSDLLTVKVGLRKDGDYVHFHGKNVLVCGKWNLSARLDEMPEVEVNGIKGRLRIKLEGMSNPLIYEIHIEEGPYRGFHKRIQGEMQMSRENFDKAFYAFYFREEKGHTVRCPAESLEEAFQQTSGQ